MRHRTSWNLKKHCISAVKTLKSRSRHHQKASKTAAKNESEKEVKKVPKKIRRWKLQLANGEPIPPPNPPPRFLILAFMKRSAPLRPKGTPLRALPVIRRPFRPGRRVRVHFVCHLPEVIARRSALLVESRTGKCHVGRGDISYLYDRKLDLTRRPSGSADDGKRL